MPTQCLFSFLGLKLWFFLRGISQHSLSKDIIGQWRFLACVPTLPCRDKGLRHSQSELPILLCCSDWFDGGHVTQARRALGLLGKRLLFTRDPGQKGCYTGLWSPPSLITGGGWLSETCLEESRPKKQKVAESRRLQPAPGLTGTSNWDLLNCFLSQ